MAGSTYKFGRRKPFTTIYNSVIRDTRLSLKARGLFAVMASLPDDWEFTVGGLATAAGVGKDTIRTTLNELQKVGYLVREQSHDEGGKFAKNVYILQEEAPLPLSGNPDNGEAPLSGNPVNGKTRQREDPMTDIPTQQNIDKIKDIYTPLTPQGGRRVRHKKAPREAPDWQPERFNGFWQFYPKEGRQNKQDAMDAWDELKPNDELIAQIGRALKKLKATERWQRGIGIPYAQKFLRKALWTNADELGPDTPTNPGEAPREVFGWQ